ncbi:MAG: dephospho-CoA kinase [Betaproteobacteria bacterium]
MFRVGLTGGIGSGKSAAAELLRAHGADLVDADAIAHTLTAPAGAAIGPIRARFGNEVVDASGALDRARMRALAFGDDGVRHDLEAILHPLIRAQAQRQVEASTAPYVVLAIPLLVESGNWSERVDRVLVVDVPEDVQVARVTRTRGLTEHEVRAIVARQASRAARLAAADDVLCNDGTPAELASRVARLHASYAATARARVIIDC